MQFLVASSYPYAARYIRGELPKVVNRHRILAALMQHGHLSPDLARRTLGPDTTLKINAVDRGPGRYGYYAGAGDIAQIARTILRQYDRLMALVQPARGLPHEWRMLLRRANGMLEAAILHQVVNWGAVKAGKPRGKTSLTRPQTEPGDEFEIQAYGGIVSTQGIPGWIGWGYVPEGDGLVATAFDEAPDYPPGRPPGNEERAAPSGDDS